MDRVITAALGEVCHRLVNELLYQLFPGDQQGDFNSSVGLGFG